MDPHTPFARYHVAIMNRFDANYIDSELWLIAYHEWQLKLKFRYQHIQL